jgi:hypothetical protein
MCHVQLFSRYIARLKNVSTDINPWNVIGMLRSAKSGVGGGEVGPPKRFGHLLWNVVAFTCHLHCSLCNVAALTKYC